jgi:hypothetical protein
MKKLLLFCITLFVVSLRASSGFEERKLRKINKELKIVRVPVEEIDKRGGTLVKSPPLFQKQKRKLKNVLNLKEKKQNDQDNL